MLLRTSIINFTFSGKVSSKHPAGQPTFLDLNYGWLEVKSLLIENSTFYDLGLICGQKLSAYLKNITLRNITHDDVIKLKKFKGKITDFHD